MIPMKKKLLLHTDGGARGNPGLAGAGAVVYDASGKTINETSKYLGEKTNNFAEYSGVILGLEMIAKHFGKAQCKNFEIIVRMDSELICKQLNGEYQIKEETLFPLYIKVHNLLVSTFSDVTFEHVPRAENAHADRLANEAMNRAS
jgi:ribonuclease HI